MLTIDERKIAGPGTGAPPADGSSSFRRILVPVSATDESRPALAVAARNQPRSPASGGRHQGSGRCARFRFGQSAGTADMAGRSAACRPKAPRKAVPSWQYVLALLLGGEEFGELPYPGAG